jgi:hypothetical protein
VGAEYTLSQFVGTTCCADNVILSATVVTQFGFGSMSFGIAPGLCSAAQDFQLGTVFVEYDVAFAVAPGTALTLSVTINPSPYSGFRFAGMGEFSISVS